MAFAIRELAHPRPEPTCAVKCSRCGARWLQERGSGKWWCFRCGAVVDGVWYSPIPLGYFQNAPPAARRFPNARIRLVGHGSVEGWWRGARAQGGEGRAAAAERPPAQAAGRTVPARKVAPPL